MSAPQLPGYYYDPVKKKYFKIEAGHDALPGASITQQHVNAKNAKVKKLTKAEKWKKRCETELIKRSSVMQMPTITINREIDSRNSTAAYQSNVQALTQARMLKYSWHMDYSTHIGQGAPENDSFTVKSVMRDPRTGILVAGLSYNQQSSILVTYPRFSETDGKWVYRHHDQKELIDAPYDLSSLTLSPTRHLLSTFNSGSPLGDTFISITKLMDPDENGSFQGFPYPSYRKNERRTSFWASAAEPTLTNHARFAIGTSRGVQIIDASQNTWHMEKVAFSDRNAPAGSTTETRSSANAVDWLNPITIVAGMRSRAVVVCDLRTQTSSFKLRHDRPVFEVKKVDDYRVVAAGPNSLKMYDLRWAPDEGQATRPYLPFPQYIGMDIPRFDLNSELGLLVALNQSEQVQDDVLDTYSLRTGRRAGGVLPRRNFHSSSPLSVTFDRGCDLPEWRGPRAPSLLFGADLRVEEWTW